MGGPAFSELDFDALREIMNVGFGQAASTLSEVIDLHVALTVPRIAIMETGSVGTIAEPLKDQVLFKPPLYFPPARIEAELSRHLGPGLALLFKTVLRFEARNLFGFLFLITAEGSVAWLKESLTEFIDVLSDN